MFDSLVLGGRRGDEGTMRRNYVLKVEVLVIGVAVN